MGRRFQSKGLRWILASRIEFILFYFFLFFLFFFFSRCWRQKKFDDFLSRRWLKTFFYSPSYPMIFIFIFITKHVETFFWAKDFQMIFDYIFVWLWCHCLEPGAFFGGPALFLGTRCLCMGRRQFCIGSWRHC